MITRETIIEAYLFLKENNQSIPDETLDFMKRSSLEALTKAENLLISGVRDRRALLIEFAEFFDQQHSDSQHTEVIDKFLKRDKFNQ